MFAGDPFFCNVRRGGIEMPKYEVIVGNIGTVHTCNNPVDACRVYGDYKKQSEANIGRASGESVVVMEDHEFYMEYVGTIEE